MNNEPHISIIILNWNKGNLTVRCLESLYGVNYTNYNVVVLDNGSSDNSLEIIKEWGLQKKNITILRSEENGGYAGGMNNAIDYALRFHNPEYVYLLNNDALIDKDCLINSVQAVKNENADIVGSLVMSMDGGTILFAGGDPEKEFFAGTLPSQTKTLPPVWYPGRVEGSGMLISSSYLREMIEKYGFIFHPGLFLYGEDIDFAMIARKHHKRIIMTNNAIIYHEIGQSGGGGANRLQYYYSTRNRVFLANRWLHGWKKILFHSYYIPTRIARSLQRLLQGRSEIAMAIVDALIDGYSGKYGKWKKHGR